MISGLSIKAGLKAGITPRTLIRGSPHRNHVVKPVHYKERDDAEKFKQDASKAFDQARDKAEDTKDRAVDSARDMGDKARAKTDDAREGMRKELDKSSNAALAYTAGAIAWPALIVYQLLRPENALAIFFRHTLTATGAEAAALTGAMSSSTFLLQAFAVLGFPIAMGLLSQAHASRNGRLDSDSSMRLNFGFALHAVWLLGAVAASPLWQNFGALAVTGVAGYILSIGWTTLRGVKESRKFEDFSDAVQGTIKGTIATLLRTIMPRSLGGAVYGILAVCAASAALATVFAQPYVSEFFSTNAAEAAYQVAKGDLIQVLTRGVGANFAFAAVALAALKELADKNALAATTARFLNFGFAVTSAAFALLLNWGRQHSIASTQGAGWFGLATQLSAFAVLASIYFVIYPGSKSTVKQDTGAECYT